jgi:hypothetical protein
MNLLEQFWKIVSAAWAQIVRSLTCTLLSTKLRLVNEQIDGAQRYIAAVKESSTNLTKSLARYFSEQLPMWMAEREGLEAEMEFNGCNKEN